MSDDEDVDVVWAGSPLDEHIKASSEATNLSEEDREVMAAFRKEDTAEEKSLAKSERVSFGVTSLTWPQVERDVLEVAVAQKLLVSELLVAEDDEFLRSFVLTDEAMERYRKATISQDGASPRSYLSEALLLTGSLACVAGAVMYLSERTRLAATAAAILPTALAAASAIRSSSAEPDVKEGKRRGEMALVDSPGKSDRQIVKDQQFEKLVDQLLTDMKLFKQLVRKSLNLLQGMELMHSGYHFGVNSTTGASSVTVPGTGRASDSAQGASELGGDDNPLAKALKDRACFPALRMATYKATVSLIRSYRTAVGRLLEVSPLADHVDLKEHYLAFIDLKNFGISEVEGFIEEENGEEGAVVGDASAVSVKALKDVVQLALIQQSEYLRRFALAFSARAREEEEEGTEVGLNKAGILKQVRDLVGSLRQINSKLSRVFDYHQAMGVISEDKQNALLAKRSSIHDLVPLRTVYTSLFSTGLHLQNSLLKVRQLERAFDSIEQCKNRETDMVTALLPSEGHLLDWLNGFQAIQGELNACVGCLDEGLLQIDHLNNGEKKVEQVPVIVPKKVEESEPKKELPVVSAKTAVVPRDEVFEAVTLPEDSEEEEERRRQKKKKEETPAMKEERKRQEREKRQSERLLTELRGVLVERAARTEEREAKAIQRDQEQPRSPPFVINMDDLSPEPVEALKEVVEQIVEDQTALVREIQKSDPFLCESLARSLEESDNSFGDAFVKAEEELTFEGLKTALSMPLDKAAMQNGGHSPRPGVSKSTSSYLGSLSENSSSSEDETESRDSVSKASDVEDDSSEMAEGPDSCSVSVDSSDTESSSSASTSASSSQDTVKSVSRASEDETDFSSARMPRSVSGHELKQQRRLRGNGSSSDSDTGAVGDMLSRRAKKVRRQRMRGPGQRDQYIRSLSMVPRQKLLSEASTVTASEKISSCSLSELRSISSPDIKRLLQQEASSPYVSLENLRNKNLKLSKIRSELSTGDSSEESCGSADEMQHQVLKTYKRPLRPAAMKSNGTNGHRGSPKKEKENGKERKGSVTSMTSITSVGSTSSIRSTRKKRDRNRTRSIHSGDLVFPGADAAEEKKAAPAPAVTNSYVERKAKEGSGAIFLPSLRPSGFESSIARQAAAKAANGLNGLFRPAMEEVFGGSDSGGEEGSKD